MEKRPDLSGRLRERGRSSNSGRESDRLLEGDIDLDRDLVADQPAACLESNVPVEVPVLAIDLALALKPARRAPSMPK